MERVLRGDDEGDLHLHGHWEDPESVVLGIQSYELCSVTPTRRRFCVAAPEAHARVHRLRRRLGDPEFGALLAWSRPILAGSEYRHFRLCRTSEREELERQHPREDGSSHCRSAKSMKISRRSCVTWRPGEDRRSHARARPPVDVVALPAKPARCIGRDREVETLVGALLAGEPTPVLGPAGIGKSTVCLEALHDERSPSASADAATSSASTAHPPPRTCSPASRAVLGNPADQTSIGAVVGHLAGQPAALALDNLETPWEADTLETETLLAELAAVPGLSLTVTVRSRNRPGGVAWREAIEVVPSGNEDAKRVFLAIAGDRHAADAHLASCWPRSTACRRIELMAYAAESEPDLAWHLAALADRADGNADARREREPPAQPRGLARAVDQGPAHDRPCAAPAVVLGVLPDGIARGDLEALLPGFGNAAAGILRQVALAFDEAGRLRTLAPVREHVAVHHPPASEDLARAIDHYAGLAKELGPKCGAEGGAEAVARLPARPPTSSACCSRTEKRPTRGRSSKLRSRSLNSSDSRVWNAGTPHQRGRGSEIDR